jgi:protease PrsW
LGILVVFWLLRREFASVRDGIVYGALIGVGFNWFESALYVAQGYEETGVAPYGFQLGARYALFGLGGHAMFSAIFGAFVGLATHMRRRWLRIIAPIAGLLLAIAAHMLNDALPLIATLASVASGAKPPAREPLPDLGFLQAFLSGSLIQLTIFLPFIAVVAVVLWRTVVWERRVIREELVNEVGRAVTEDEYRDVVGDKLMRTRRINRLRPMFSAALVNAQHELAFRKRRVKIAKQDVERDALVARWRQHIARVRASASGADAL